MKPEQWMRSVAVTFNVRVTPKERTDFDLRANLLLLCNIVGACWVYPLPRARLKRKVVSAPRLAYAMFNGPLDADDDVVASCGCETCCNPSHLALINVKREKKFAFSTPDSEGVT